MNFIPQNIRVRDPFILAENGLYYLYASAALREGSGFLGVEVYTSADLRNWSAPKPVLTLPPDSAVTDVWAPEVHACNGAYYMFVTFTFNELLSEHKPVDAPDWPELKRRGTWVLRADSPNGAFTKLRDASHTPESWMALDGTLFVEDETPHMVFCHEWIQLVDGSMDVVRLSSDLSDTISEPLELFKAGSAMRDKTNVLDRKVTDGPFLYRSQRTQRLFMIWSTFVPGHRYCVLQTRSTTGRIAGPWSAHEPLYMGNGGHGMLFNDFEGRLLLSLHQPNTEPLERLRLFELCEDDAGLRVVAEVAL